MRKIKLDAWYHQRTDAELMAIFDRIGTRPENRVKKTGHIKLKAARFGDAILDLILSRD